MKNRYMLVFSIAAIMVLSVVAFVPAAMAGNGAPSGGHDWNLNIIGVQNPKNFDIDLVNGHDNGRRLFVGLNKNGDKITTRIYLVMGDTFQVIDPDGTDGSAKLQLMDPYPNDDPTDPTTIDPATPAAYQILIRALGKPGGKAVITPGFINESGTVWFSLNNVTIERKNGKSVFDDRTLDLTTVYVQYIDDTEPQYYPIFGNENWDYFWEYDNYGMKLIQMRFYLNE